MSPSVYAADAKRPAYLVPFAKGELKPDGKLDEAAWSAAEWSREFVWIDAGDKAPVRARFKMLYDRQALHFAFEYFSPPLPEIPLDPDMPRACEIFLDPEGRGSRYWEYAVSPEGDQHSLVWSGRLSIREWDSSDGPTTQVGIGRTPIDKQNERTIYELSFPWKSLSKATGSRKVPPARGDAWRANFSRVETSGDFVWAPASFYYMHNPNTFGWLVFGGEKDPLTSTNGIDLTPLPDDTTLIKLGKQFTPLSPTHWVGFPVAAAVNGDLFVTTKTAIERVAPSGERRFTITRRAGLPQFIRSFAVIGDTAYVAGNGLGPGFFRVDSAGKVKALSKADGYVLGGVPALVQLSDKQLLATVNNQYQLLGSDFLQPPRTATDKIQSAVTLDQGLLAVGTVSGFELRDAQGKLLSQRKIAGGITKAIRYQGAAIGISSKTGLYRMEASGVCGYFPVPLRFKMDTLHIDPSGRLWAPYVDGLVAIDKGHVQYFHEPLGMTGVHFHAAASDSQGATVFLATMPNSTWYRSSPLSSFLLVRSGNAWKRVTYADGLPGHVSAITSLNGRILISTTMGVFEFRP
jgi:hypothetical protein